MPGKYGSVDVLINYDAAPGGTLSDVTQHVREIGGVKIENLTQETHSFGDPWIENTPTGVRRVPAIVIKGLFDTTAVTGPHVVFMPTSADVQPSAATRTLEVTFGDAKKFTVETRLQNYEVLAKNAALTEYAATLLPTGAGVWT
jgi:hypothetical protein